MAFGARCDASMVTHCAQTYISGEEPPGGVKGQRVCSHCTNEVIGGR